MAYSICWFVIVSVTIGRTGAQPAIAMKYLAAKSDIITVIGAGRQAFYAVTCISKVHKIKELRIVAKLPRQILRRSFLILQQGKKLVELMQTTA